MFGEKFAGADVIERDGGVVWDDGDERSGRSGTSRLGLDSAVHCDLTAARRSLRPVEEPERRNQRAGRFGYGGRIPGLLRGDVLRQSLVGTFGVVDPVELVDLRLQLLER